VDATRSTPRVGKRGIVATIAGMALLLTGCAAPEPASEKTPPPTPSATLTEATATVSQVASVIARYEKDIRQTADEFDDCLWSYLDANEDDPIATLEAMRCFATHKTVTLRAISATTDLSEVVAPTEVEALTTETATILGMLATVRIDACGDLGTIPDLDDDECSTAVNSLGAYLDMASENLDAWGPYL